VEHLGNVDLLVAFANGRRCPIEIKSWQSTCYRLRFNRALRQVQQQRDALLAQNAVLWLPEAKIRNAGYRRDIVVVQGDEHYLIECLRKLKYRFVVQFPQAPPRALREQLFWTLRFRWNPRGKCWEGRCREAVIDPIRRDVARAGGTIYMP
jgi:Holliday junction resolvase-like predicted endonuclease